MQVRGSALAALASTVLLCGVAQAQQPVTLHEAVARAISRSPEARASAAMVAMQAASVVQARLRPNPRLFLQSEDVQPWARNFSFANNTEDYGYLSQTLELDGKRSRRIALAQSELARARAEQDLRLRQLTAAVANAYWASAAAQRARELWKQQLDDYDAIVRYHQQRVDAGAMAGVDLIRIRIERDRTALAYSNAQRTEAQRALELARSVGDSATGPQAGLRATESIETAQTITPRPIEPILDGRADVVAAQDAQASAQANERLQHALGVPDLDLLGGYKRDVGADTLYAGLQIPIPFFNRNQGEIARAQAQKTYAGAIVDQTRIAARTEILTAESEYDRLQAQVSNVLLGMRGDARQNSAIISDAYASGSVDLLRYLDARRTVIDVELLALQTFEQYQLAATQLRILYGEQL